MATFNLTYSPIRSLPARSKSLLAALLAAFVGWCTQNAWAEPVYPVALMNWMVDGTFHALIADKSEQRLTVWKIKDGEPKLVESFRCSTGENEGDKWVRGDMKTPEGVYFFCSVIDGKTLPAKYGLWAFTTDYPNFVDRRRGKSGDGIWLHGRDKPLGPRPDSNGCIALNNADLIKVSRFIRLQGTPLIVVDKLKMAPRSVILEQERGLRNFIERWRQNWESKDLDAYMSAYSTNFQSCWFDYKGWREKKQKLNKRYKAIHVKLGNIYLYRQNGIVSAIFTQEYSSETYRSAGIKVLYITDSDSYKIYAEDYHKPVDDTFPVAPLLASAGVDVDAGAGEETTDFRIRLVSTDEPNQAPAEEIETPRPSAPSRGVMIGRLAEAKTVPSPPAIETNVRISSISPSERLTVVANNTPSPNGSESLAEDHSVRLEAARRNEPLHSGSVQSQISGAPPPVAGSDAPTLTAALNPVANSIRIYEKKDVDNQWYKTAAESSTSVNGADQRKFVQEFLKGWKAAWEKKDLDRFAKMYHPDFQQGSMDYKAFLKSKKRFFGKYRTIRVDFTRVEIRKADGQVVVKFVQSFQGDGYRDKGWKSLVLAGGKDKGFRIISEDWSAL